MGPRWKGPPSYNALSGYTTTITLLRNFKKQCLSNMMNRLFAVMHWKAFSVLYNQKKIIPMSTSATSPIVTPKKLIHFCPPANSTSTRSKGTVLSSEAPCATFRPDQEAPKLFVPSKGWPSCRNNEQLRALPEPPGTIPIRDFCH